VSLSEGGRRAALAVATLLIVGSLAVPTGIGRAAEGPTVSLEFSVVPGAYQNAVRAASVNDLLYPRIAADRGPASPFNGTVYVIGLSNITCAALIVIRSLDAGRSFEPPHSFDLCLVGPSLDVTVGRGGALFVSTWGPTVLGSVDGGLSWSVLATLGTASSPSSIAADPVSGTVHVTWGPADDPWTFSPGPILLSSSADGGQNWTAPVALISAPSFAPAIDVSRPTPGAAQDVFAAARPQITAFGDAVLVGLIAADLVAPYVAAIASQDGGRTWGNVTPVSSAGPCMERSVPSVAASPTGAFAIAWNEETASGECGSDWGNSTRAFVAVSLDGGTTFSNPAAAGGPPAWLGAGFGDAVAFDDTSRLFVTWHSISPGWTSATVYVANSTDFGQTFEAASFTTGLRVAGGNATAQENLAAGPAGLVFLAWESFGPPGNPTGPTSGVFVRSVAGEAVGDIVTGGLTPDVVEIEVRDLRTGVVRAMVPWTGSPAAMRELPPSAYVVVLRLDNATLPAGSMPVETWGRTAFTLRIGAADGGPFPWLVVVALTVGVLVVSGSLATLYYTRLAREEVLQRKVRLLIYEYIRDNPGCSYSAVRDALGLQNGVATYHLGVLEKQGLVHSETRRRHRWYYPTGDVSLWRNLPLSPLQSSLLEAIRRAPGIGIRELAREVNRRPSSVAYNVRALAREGLLRTDRPAFQRVQCFASHEDSSA